MSTVAAETVSLPRLVDHGRVTQWHVVRSEWRKLISLRSSRWSLGVFVLLTIGLSVLFAAVTSAHWGHMSVHDRADRHPLDIALAGVNLSQLAIGVLGVLVITGEYSTGMIRSTFAAVPKRLPVLWAKIGVYCSVVFALMLPASFLAFFVTQSIVSQHHVQTTIGAPHVLRAVVGAALFLTITSLLGLALGFLVRNTAGGIAAFAGVMFVLPGITAILPHSWGDSVDPYLPLSAGTVMLGLHPDPTSLGAWTGMLLYLGYALAALAVATVALLRRDA
jgi:hypothetical protein